MKFKLIGVIAVLVLLVATVAVASGMTGAYFSETQKGNITADVGTVHVGLYGDNTFSTWKSTIAFGSILPGDSSTQELVIKNNGTGPESIWLALNQSANLTKFAGIGTADIHVYGSNGVLLAHPDDAWWTAFLSGTAQEVDTSLASGDYITVYCALSLPSTVTDTSIEGMDLSTQFAVVGQQAADTTVPTVTF